MPNKFIWYKHKVAGPFEEITDEWIDRWMEIVDDGKADGVPDAEPLTEDMENFPEEAHIFHHDDDNDNTILADIIGVPGRLAHEEPEEYIERVISENWVDILDAVKFDIAMETIDWSVNKDMTVEEFSVGWTKVYAENIIKTLGFEDIPLL